MYKQNPGDPKKKLNTPGTFREDAPITKLANDGSNPMFKLDSGIYKHEAGHKEKGDKIKTEKLKEVVVYAQQPKRKSPSEVGGKDAKVMGGKKFTAEKGKPVI